MAIPATLTLSWRASLGFVAMGLSWGSYAAQVPVIKTRIGASDAEFGTILSIAPLGLLLAVLLGPRLDDRLGANTLRFLGICVAASFLLPGLATGPLVFGVGLFAVTLASGSLDIVANARVSELEASEGRSLMNFNHAMFSLAYALGAVFAGAAREAGLLPPAVFAMVLAVVVAGALWARVAPAPLAAGATAGALPVPVIVLGGLVVMAAFMVEGGTESWSALHIERTLGGRAAEGALGPAMLGLTMGLGRLGGQALSGRMRDPELVALAACVTAVGGWIAAAAGSPLVAYTGFGLLGLGVSVMAPTALAIVGRRVGPGPRARAMALVSILGFAGFFIGPPMMGFLSDAYGLRVAFAVLAGGVLLALIPLRFLMRIERR